ncbi:hypothetical protein JW899_03645 [Candidatus Uhrbacteria bacterium]|nr:hypothetical protein [Candidatus Uhrbacteria bacterium]
MKKVLWTVLTVWVAGCMDNPCAYIENRGSNFDVVPTGKTPDGIAVDDNLVGFSQEGLGEIIDRQASEVEECLERNFGSGLDFPFIVTANGDCTEEVGTGLASFREEIAVEISGDFSISHDGTQKLLPLKAEDSVCLAKGLDPKKGQCRYRVSVQNCTEIIIPPSGYLFKDGLIRVITGCANPWGHPLLAECAAPSVPALSGIEPIRK